MIIWNWIKKFGMKEAVREMDLAKPYIAGKIREAQKQLNNISPDQFADLLVTELQVSLCKRFDIDPKSIGIKGE